MTFQDLNAGFARTQYRALHQHVEGHQDGSLQVSRLSHHLVVLASGEICKAAFSLRNRSATLKLWSSMFLVQIQQQSGLLNELSILQGKCEAADVPGSTPWSCIIFTEQKISCMALSRLFAACKAHLTFLRPAELMGYGDTRAGLSHTSAVRPFLPSSLQGAFLGHSTPTLACN